MKEKNKNHQENESGQQENNAHENIECANCRQQEIKSASSQGFLETSDYQEKFMRAMADFQNFRNRIEQEKLSWSTGTKIEVIRSFLSIIDDFQRASLSAPDFEQGSPANAWKNGIIGVSKNIEKTLKSLGVIEIDCKGSFDPKFHEALCKVPAEGQFHSGDIVQVLARGYMLDGIVIRHAQVSVAD